MVHIYHLPITNHYTFREEAITQRALIVVVVRINVCQLTNCD